MPAKRKPKIVNCTHCGQEIIKTRYKPGQERFFCNRACYRSWCLQQRVTVPCASCGAQLTRPKSMIHDHNFCNSTCHGKWTSEHMRGSNAPRWNGGSVTVFCETCGKSVERTRYEVENRSERFFCCLKCRYQWQSEHVRGEDHPNWEDTHLETECAQCGQPLSIPAWRVSRAERFFCDYQCSADWKSENLTGDRLYNWKGGAEPYYGPNWTRQKNKARKRDNYHCRLCGTGNKNTRPRLDVHHIKPFRDFGYIRDENDNFLQANHLSNLLTLCRACHIKVENGLLAPPLLL